MPHRTIHHQEPVSGFGGFLLLAGFLIAAIGLLVAFGSAAGAGATTTEQLLASLEPYAIPIALTGLLVAGLGLALDQRRMARTVHSSIGHTTDALYDQLERERSRERRDRQKASMSPRRNDSPPADDLAAASEPATTTRPATDRSPPPTSAVDPDVMPREVSAGTRHMHMPIPPPGEPAYPWSGGPGAPPPGPDPSGESPHWQSIGKTQTSAAPSPGWHSEGETQADEGPSPGWRRDDGPHHTAPATGHPGHMDPPSARAEPWRQSRVRIIDRP